MNGAEIKAGVETFIRALPYGTKSPQNLYAPMEYLLSHEAKRVRPVMAVLAYQYLGGSRISEMIASGTAIELVHNFTLMHDDIMDRAPVRRGQPTVHIKWDTNTAILSGDALFALAYPMLIQNFPDKAAELIPFFTKVIVEVCEGQMEDMLMADENKSDIPMYLEMIRKKTAALLGGSLGIGAIAAGADEKTVRDIYLAGELMGLGFQLQDDLLDVYADQAKFGKQVGGDIIENKKTYLLLRALEKADRYRKETLLNWLQHTGDPQEKISGVMEIYHDLDIAGDTRTLISEYYGKADIMLKNLPELPGKSDLTEYLQAVFMRDK